MTVDKAAALRARKAKNKRDERARRTAAELAEVRGIYAPPAEHNEIRALVRRRRKPAP